MGFLLFLVACSQTWVFVSLLIWVFAKLDVHENFERQAVQLINVFLVEVYVDGDRVCAMVFASSSLRKSNWVFNFNCFLKRVSRTDFTNKVFCAKA